MNEKHKAVLQRMIEPLRQKIHIWQHTRQHLLDVPLNKLKVKKAQEKIDALEAALDLAEREEGIPGVMV